jgi:hypothetical protein
MDRPVNRTSFTAVHLEYVNFIAYVLMQNLIKLYSVEMCTIHYIICHILLFLCRLEYKVFYIENLAGL